MDNLERLIQLKLVKFLVDRKDIFPNVTSKQHDEWRKNITKQIQAMLDDNDIFYDNMPDDVESDEN